MAKKKPTKAEIAEVRRLWVGGEKKRAIDLADACDIPDEDFEGMAKHRAGLKK